MINKILFFRMVRVEGKFKKKKLKKTANRVPYTGYLVCW